jgi:hypothetical protein
MHQLTDHSVNPHFDHGRVIWDDQYSGQYQPVE